MNRRTLREDSIEGLRQRARRRLPRMVFDFLDGGAESERALRLNVEALNGLSLVPNAFEGAEPRDLTVELLGRKVSMPLIIGPTGLAALAWPRADQLLACAAQAAGIPFVVSTSSSVTLEQIAAAAPSARLWMQIYPYKNRELVRSLIQRAARQGFEALVVTVDTPVLGHRSRDHANRFSVPLRPTLGLVRELLRCPAWTAGILRHGLPRMRNLLEHADGRALQSLMELINRNMNAAASWADLAWIRDEWGGKLVLKGILSAAGTERAVKEGVDAIVVSNHGGRQLDAAPASVTMLPEVAGAAGGQCETYIDGGIRTGSDIARAIALGARAAMIGRPALYGVAAAGAVGASHAIDLFRSQYDRVLALLGCKDSAAVSTIRVIRSSAGA